MALFLVLALAALLVCAVYGVVALAILINFDIVPRPERHDLAAWLDWHRVPRVRLLPAVAVASPTLMSTADLHPATFALAALMLVTLAVGDSAPVATVSGGEPAGASPAVRLPAA